jgi:hypothetical protein
MGPGEPTSGPYILQLLRGASLQGPQKVAKEFEVRRELSILHIVMSMSNCEVWWASMPAMGRWRRGALWRRQVSQTVEGKEGLFTSRKPEYPKLDTLESPRELQGGSEKSVCEVQPLDAPGKEASASCEAPHGLVHCYVEMWGPAGGPAGWQWWLGSWVRGGGDVSFLLNRKP